MKILFTANVIIPKYKRIIAVYKINFDTGHFYIGMTCDLSKRISVHKTNAKLGKELLYIKAVSIGATRCTLEVLCVFKNKNAKSRAFVIEKQTIINSIGNPLLLNQQLNNKYYLRWQQQQPGVAQN